jgi:hypothetical protein
VCNVFGPMICVAKPALQSFRFGEIPQILLIFVHLGFFQGLCASFTMQRRSIQHPYSWKRIIPAETAIFTAVTCFLHAKTK